MKTLKLRTFVIFALAALAGAALLHTSQRVQEAEEELAAINASIAKEEESIRILSAEWEYLNRPERLEKMAREFLDLVPPAPDKMPEDMIDKASTLPDRLDETVPAAQAQDVSFEASPEQPSADIPKPAVKPSNQSALPEMPTPPQVERTPDETPKAFGDLLKELGGDQ